MGNVRHTDDVEGRTDEDACDACQIHEQSTMRLRSTLHPRPGLRSRDRHKAVAVVVAVLIAGAAIMTIMLAQGVSASILAYTVVLALTVVGGVVMFRASRCEEL